jgi:hypothetical protein
METKIINKNNLQAILKSLRGTSFCEVTKVNNGYEVIASRNGKNISKGDVLLKAMKGNNGYLVRVKVGLLSTA